MKVSSPTKLLFDQLRDLYSMEIQLAGSLPYLAENATHVGLKDRVTRQSYRTYRRKVQLLVIFRCHEIAPGTDKCRVIEGLVRGGENHLLRIEDLGTRDLMILSQCLRIAEYGISGYKIASDLARRIGFLEEAAALSLLQKEEEAALERMKEIEAEVFDDAHSSERNLAMAHS